MTKLPDMPTLDLQQQLLITAALNALHGCRPIHLDPVLAAMQFRSLNCPADFDTVSPAPDTAKMSNPPSGVDRNTGPYDDQ